MHPVWKTSIRFALLSTVLLGLGYPLAITGVANILFPRKAAGSLLLKNGQVVGSYLLAQGFSSDRYFHPRPSAAGSGYDASNSGASNLAQTNASFVRRTQSDIDRLRTENPGQPVPIDLVTASGSGLDPDITPDAAFYQVPRVARARGLSQERVRELIRKHIVARQFGLLGEQRVNVLQLNMDLDQLSN